MMSNDYIKNSKIWTLLKALILVIPLTLPFWVDNQYYVHSILGRIFIYTILVISLDLVTGYIGDISIGHAGLFAVGAYTMAILNTSQLVNDGATIWYFPELPYLFSILIAMAVTAVFGALLGWPSLRASGPYLAVTTIAYGLIIYTFINEQIHLTNGTKGIQMPPLKLLNFPLDANNFIWLVYPILLLVMYCKNNLAKSFWGRAFEALKYSPIAAEACGISKVRFKLSAFVLSAAIAGLAGALFVHLDNYIAPNTFTLEFSILALMALIFGGVRSTLGNVVGMSLVVILPDLFTWFKDFRLLVFGVLLLLALFYLPQGLAGLIKQAARKIWSSGGDEQEIQKLQKLSATLNLFASNVTESKAPSSQSPLKLIGLEMRFGGLKAVDHLDLNVKPGSIHGLMGPNGSGKSTTVNLITGLYKPTQGDVLVFGQNINKLKPFQRAKFGISRTFQNLQLFGDLSVLDNVLVGLHQTYRSGLGKILLGLPQVRKEEELKRAEAYKWLEFVGLQKLAFEKAKSLAYGQARRLEIARALALKPRLLLLDEPAAGLTTAEIQEFNAIILKIKSHGISILLIEHHMDMMMQVSDDITVLDFGKKIAEGAPTEIQKNSRVISAYLGVAGSQHA